MKLLTPKRRWAQFSLTTVMVATALWLISATDGIADETARPPTRQQFAAAMAKIQAIAQATPLFANQASI